MSYSITLPEQNIYAIGNPTQSRVSIDTSTSSNVVEVKTLVKGIWKSWQRDVDTAFQTLKEFEPGRGYIIKTLGQATINFPDDQIIDLMDIPIIIGDNLITVPYTLTTAPNERFTADLIKTLDNTGIWKSWIKDTAVEFQGFNSLLSGTGYYANVISLNETVKDWFDDGIPVYTVSPDINLIQTDVRQYEIILPYKYLNIYEIYVIDYGTIYTGWEYNRLTNRLILNVTDIDIMREMSGRKVKVYGVTAVN